MLELAKLPVVLSVNALELQQLQRFSVWYDCTAMSVPGGADVPEIIVSRPALLLKDRPNTPDKDLSIYELLVKLEKAGWHCTVARDAATRRYVGKAKQLKTFLSLLVSEKSAVRTTPNLIAMLWATVQKP